MGRLNTKLYNKRNDFTFPIVNFPLISSNIPAAPASIAQLIRYSKLFTVLFYQISVEEPKAAQRYVTPRLKSSDSKLYDGHHEQVDRYTHLLNEDGSFLFLVEFVICP